MMQIINRRQKYRMGQAFFWLQYRDGHGRELQKKVEMRWPIRI